MTSRAWRSSRQTPRYAARHAAGPAVGYSGRHEASHRVRSPRQRLRVSHRTLVLRQAPLAWCGALGWRMPLVATALATSLFAGEPVRTDADVVRPAEQAVSVMDQGRGGWLMADSITADAAGNPGQGTLRETGSARPAHAVPAAGIAALTATVTRLADQGQVPRTCGSAWVALLRNVAGLAAGGNARAASEALVGFVRQVRLEVAATRLTVARGDHLVGTANQVIAALAG